MEKSCYSCKYKDETASDSHCAKCIEETQDEKMAVKDKDGKEQKK